jgi:hypothetical protein
MTVSIHIFKRPLLKKALPPLMNSNISEARQSFLHRVSYTPAQGVKVRNKMNRLQRMVCLAITGAMSSTPLAAMESLLGFLPLHMYIESVAKREMYRLSVGKLTTISCYNKGHSKIWTELMNHDPILSAPSDFEGVNPFNRNQFSGEIPKKGRMD